MVELFLYKPESRILDLLARQIRALTDRNEHVMLIVPDQYTLEAERGILESLHIDGFMNLEVLSFNRLASRIAEQTGRIPLTDQGKSMVIKRLIHGTKEELGIFRTVSGYRGFVDQCSDLFTNLSASMLTCDQLDAYVNEHNTLSARKMKDISLLYRLYHEYTEGRFADPSRSMSELAARIPVTGAVSDVHVFIYGFSVFTEQLYGVLEQLIVHSRSLHLALPYSPCEEEADMYRMQSEVVERMEQLAADHNQLVKTHFFADSHKPEEILHLGANLFCVPFTPVTEPVEHVELFYAQGVYAEIEYMAGRICQLVRQGARFNQIFVACNALDSYGPVLERVFSAYQIPYFMDTLRPVTNHPFIHGIMALLEILTTDFAPAAVLKYLKSGLTPLEEGVVERFEKMCAEAGIRRGDIKQGLAARHRADPEHVALFDEVSDQAIAPVRELSAALRDVTVRRGCVILYEFIREHLFEPTVEFAREQERLGFTDAARVSAQIFNCINDTLEQAVLIMGEDPLDMTEFSAVIGTGFDAYRSGIIPTTVDQVTVGDIARSKSADVRYSFILGLNEGVIPKYASGAGLFTDGELAVLKEHGIDFAPSCAELAEAEKLTIYTAFVRPSERLYLSYSSSDVAGKTAEKSSLVTRIRSVFPLLECKSQLSYDYEELLTVNEYGLLKQIARRLRTDGASDPRLRDMVRYVSAEGEGDAKARLGLVEEALRARNTAKQLNARQSRIMDLSKETSISRLETFAECAYKHFIRYGLKPAEWEKEEINSMDAGNVFHEAFSVLLSRMKEQNVDWEKLDPAKVGAQAKGFIEDVIRDYRYGKFDYSAANRAKARRVIRTGVNAAVVAAEHIAAGDFRPVEFEVKFGKNCPLPALVLQGEEPLFLRGQIDRIDILETAGKKYLRIIDYKSGEKEIDITRVYNGLQLQLLLYMAVALQAMPEAEAGGVFYYTVKDKILSMDWDTPADREAEKHAESMRLNGFFINDPQVVEGMDKQIESKSRVVNAARVAEGGYKENSELVAHGIFHRVLNMAMESASRMADAIKRGDNAINPYTEGSWNDACTYCDYRSVCGFDERFRDNQHRPLCRMTLSQLREEAEG